MQTMRDQFDRAVGIRLQIRRLSHKLLPRRYETQVKHKLQPKTDKQHTATLNTPKIVLATPDGTHWTLESVLAAGHLKRRRHSFDKKLAARHF